MEENWYRDCPRCDDPIEYTNKGSWYNARRNESTCLSCQREKCSETLKKKHASGELTMPISKPRDQYEYTHSRPCPECDNDIWYTSEKGMKNALCRGSICNSCSAKKYKKGVSFAGATLDQIKQMRASKAGFSSWEEYKEKYPKKKMYKQEVWRHTYKNDLESLEHWDKRGLCGVEGAYQLDHITSVNEGWENGIPPEEIARMDNLQMIPWEENRLKSSS